MHAACFTAQPQVCYIDRDAQGLIEVCDIDRDAQGRQGMVQTTKAWVNRAQIGHIKKPRGKPGPGSTGEQTTSM